METYTFIAPKVLNYTLVLALNQIKYLISIAKSRT